MKNRQFKVTKTYPDDSERSKQLEALRDYYGPNFNQIFFEAAFAVLGCVADQRLGVPAVTIQSRKTANQHFIDSIYLESIGQANGDITPPPSLQPIPDQQTDADLYDGLEDDEEDDPIQPSSAGAIPGDPFG